MVLTLKAVNYDHKEIQRLKQLLPDVMFSPLVRRLLTEHLDKVEEEQLKERIRSMSGGSLPEEPEEPKESTEHPLNNDPATTDQ